MMDEDRYEEGPALHEWGQPRDHFDWSVSQQAFLRIVLGLCVFTFVLAFVLGWVL